MSKTIRSLGDAELEIMSIIWAAEEPVPASYIQARLSGRSWALSTVMTSLARLMRKGFLSLEKQGRSNFYRPLVSEEDYKQSASASFVQRLYGNSISKMVAALYGSNALSQDELQSLRELLDELEEKQ